MHLLLPPPAISSITLVTAQCHLVRKAFCFTFWSPSPHPLAITQSLCPAGHGLQPAIVVGTHGRPRTLLWSTVAPSRVDTWYLIYEDLAFPWPLVQPPTCSAFHSPTHSELLQGGGARVLEALDAA